MKIGIDSYCYHRYFGEHYPQQQPAPRKMTLEDFLLRAHQLGVDGVSLESCYIDRDPGYLRNIRAILDEYKLDPVWAWGHREGLEGGSSERAYAEMISHLDCARAVGAKVMRVVGSSRNFRNQPHGPQLERLAGMFRRAVPSAEAAGIKLAIENHIDFSSDEILALVEAVASPWFGVTFDTGNFVRLLDDPVKAMDKLAKYTYATHIKDLAVRRDAPADSWYFFSSTPIGDGVVDNECLIRALAATGYKGLLAVEIDFLHPDFGDDEDAAVALSIDRLRTYAAQAR